MKVLSIAQPFASLVAAGLKRLETRSWQTKHRGDIAIHASASTAYLKISTRADKAHMRRLLRRLDPMRMGDAGFVAGLPRGEIIGVAHLEDCVPIDIDSDEGLDLLASHGLTAAEANVGDYSPGRYAWKLSRAVDLVRGVPCKGKLGLWTAPAEAGAALATVGVLSAFRYGFR